MKEPKFYKIVRPILVLFMKLFRPEIIGRENIPKKGRVVLAGNHTCFLDCLLLISSTKRVVHFLAKDELHKGKFGFIFKLMATIPVNRRQKDHKALENAIEVLNNNGLIGIFPEGTINRTKDTTLPFKYGAVKMASETDSYIVPFIITGKYKILRKSVRVIFLKKYKLKENLEEENKELRKKIEKEIERSN